jgi:hypothetical protein
LVGTWDLSFTSPKASVDPTYIIVTQENIPSAGDYMANLPDGTKLTGNSLRGTLKSEDINCLGTFDGQVYNAECKIAGYLNATLVMKKR